MIIGTCMTACAPQQKETPKPEHTPEALAMLQTLKTLPQQGVFMFGHHDDPVYGIGWDGDEGRSDVKSVCGDYPAIMSFDLGHIELGDSVNLDKVSFDRIRREVVAQYERGGMSSFSWHLDNPQTGKDTWDVSDSTVVRSILPGGTNHEKFIGWLDRAADYMNSIRTADGTKIPVLFRPWHEHTGSWFWWGQKLCSTEEYKALWSITYNRMKEKGADQLLWAYSPGTEPNDTTQYLERYPGDSIVDLIGVDAYQFNKDDYEKALDRSLRIMTEIGKAHNKAIAVTETGFETIPDSTWWTQTLMPVIQYATQSVESTLLAEYCHNRSRNNLRGQGIKTNDYLVTWDFTYNFPCHLALHSNYSYQSRRGYNMADMKAESNSKCKISRSF